MSYYIHLKHYHTAMVEFVHPLLDGVKKSSEEELNDLAKGVLDGANPDTLILALRPCVKQLVSRYLANWRVTSPFTDDMVSEGLTAISRLCQEIPLDLFVERGILKIATSRAQKDIEVALNKLQGMSAPPARTQQRRISQKKAPTYLLAETSDYEESCQPLVDSDEVLRDVLDALCKIVPEDEIDVALLDDSNWGRGHAELAEELGVAVSTIHRRKARLYEKYLELTR